MQVHRNEKEQSSSLCKQPNLLLFPGGHWVRHQGHTDIGVDQAGLSNFTTCYNSPSDAAEIKVLIKFHALRRELITAGPRGDLFLVVLTSTGGRCSLYSFTHYWPLPKKRIHELAAWHPPAWLLGFLRSEAEGCRKRNFTGKRFLRERMTGAVWNVPERALGNLYAGFCPKLERREHPDDLCSFLSGVLTSLRISFTIYEIEIIIVPASRGGCED